MTLGYRIEYKNLGAEQNTVYNLFGQLEMIWVI